MFSEAIGEANWRLNGSVTYSFLLQLIKPIKSDQFLCEYRMTKYLSHEKATFELFK